MKFSGTRYTATADEQLNGLSLAAESQTAAADTLAVPPGAETSEA